MPLACLQFKAHNRHLWTMQSFKRECLIVLHYAMGVGIGLLHEILDCPNGVKGIQLRVTGQVKGLGD
jgi:hypothetical protein